MSVISVNSTVLFGNQPHELLFFQVDADSAGEMMEEGVPLRRR